VLEAIDYLGVERGKRCETVFRNFGCARFVGENSEDVTRSDQERTGHSIARDTTLKVLNGVDTEREVS